MWINDYFVCGIDIQRPSESIRQLAEDTVKIAFKTPNFDTLILNSPYTEQRPKENLKIEYPTEKGLKQAMGNTNPVKWEIYGPYFDQLNQPINPDYPSPHGDDCVLPDLVCMVNNEVFLNKEYISDIKSEIPSAVINAYEDMIDIDSVMTMEGQMCCYAKTCISSPKNQKVWLIIGNNDGFSITVNGNNVIEKDEIRLWTPYNNFTLVELNKGKNEIVIKLLKRTEILKFAVGFRQYNGNHWHRSKWCTDLM